MYLTVLSLATLRLCLKHSMPARFRPATPILARALLMLRLASARAAHLLAAAEVSKADLKFWWLPWGTDLGLWDDLDDDS